MKSLTEQMSVYQRYHTQRATKITHFIGVPMIVLAIMMALNWLEIGVHEGAHMSVMWLAVVALLIYYFLLNWRLALGMVVIFFLFGLLAQHITGTTPAWPAGFIILALFVGGWVIQLIGHHFEGKKPALMDNLFQIFIAPIFLLVEACDYFRPSK